MKFKYYRRYKRKRFSKLQKLQVAKPVISNVKVEDV